MSFSTKLDAVTLTCAAVIVFAWFVIATDIRLLLIAFGLTLAAATATRVNILLFVSCLFIPVLPIAVSHLAIEPFFSNVSVTADTRARAIEAWLRVGGMALLSITWLASLDLRRSAQLCRIVGIGQFLLLPFSIASTFVGVTRDRWLAIRELHALRERGFLRKRSHIRIKQMPGVGLQLTMASLIASGELALACNGRAIGSRRSIVIRNPEISIFGVFLVLLLTATTVVMAYVGIL